MGKRRPERPRTKGGMRPRKRIRIRRTRKKKDKKKETK